MVATGYHCSDHIHTISLHPFSLQSFHTTHSYGTVESFVLASFGSSTALRCFRASCHDCYIFVVFGQLTVTCSHLGDRMRRSLETVFVITHSTIVTTYSWTLNTLYRPSARCSILFFWLFAIFSSEFDAVAGNLRRHTSS